MIDGRSSKFEVLIRTADFAWLETVDLTALNPWACIQ